MSSLIPVSPKSAEAYETTINLFQPLFREVKEICKKKPETTVSKFKIGQVNRLLADIKIFLAKEPEAKYLDILEEDTVPQVSDLVIVMAQYEGALEAFHRRHFGYHLGAHQWLLEKK